MLGFIACPSSISLLYKTKPNQEKKYRIYANEVCVCQVENVEKESVEIEIKRSERFQSIYETVNQTHNSFNG